nr:MAG TPA: hypothetical protein [Caudoviricetes sp.]DAX72827.1 MAG TPA: hypothetical protein [Caudoviricetes sp.]
MFGCERKLTNGGSYSLPTERRDEEVRHQPARFLIY